MAGVFPLIASEQLMYSTVLITTKTGSGTGFFYVFKYENDFSVPVIVTNKHVVDYLTHTSIILRFHTGEKALKVVDDDSVEIQVVVDWFFHPTQDLCVTFLQPIIEIVEKKYNKHVFYSIIDPSLCFPKEKYRDFGAVEDVLMVGYPIGLWDAKNNFPLFRRGITASHPSVDFKDEKKEITEESIGVVDMACFPGSSGSPIFLYNPLGHNDKEKNTFVMSGMRIIFLGILSRGPQMNADGTISVRTIPTKQQIITSTPIMINLGYYIKSYELNYFQNFFKQLFNLGSGRLG